MGYFFDPTDRDDDGEYKIQSWADKDTINRKFSEDVLDITTDKIKEVLEKTRMEANELSKAYYTLPKHILELHYSKQKKLAEKQKILNDLVSYVNEVQHYIDTRDLQKMTFPKTHVNGKPVFRTYLIYADLDNQGEYYDLGMYSEETNPGFDEGYKKHRRLESISGIEYGEFTKKKKEIKQLYIEIENIKNDISKLPPQNVLAKYVTNPQELKRQQDFEASVQAFKEKVERDVVPVLSIYINNHNTTFTQAIKTSCKCASDYNGGTSTKDLITYEGIKKVLEHINKKILVYPQEKQGEK